MMLHCLVFRNIVIERIGCVFDKGNFQLVVISINGRQRKGNVSRRQCPLCIGNHCSWLIGRQLEPLVRYFFVQRDNEGIK